MLARRSQRPRLVRIGAAATIALVAAAACSREAAQPAAPAPTPVEVAQVRGPAAGATLVATGQLERGREMTLSFRIPGVITALNVDDGQPVRAGQVLATVDPTGVAAVEARADADLERARRDLARDQALFEQGFVSRQRLDDRRSALKAAQAGSSAAAFDRRWSRLTAPASGVVLQRIAQAGEVVQPGQAVLRIADESSPLILRAPLADRDVTRVRPGQGVSVRIDGLPAVVPGRVVRVGERAGAQTGAVDVEIEIAPGPGLRSGQVATAEIGVAPLAGPAMARIPAEAILEAKDAKASVLIVEDGVARRRTITFGGFAGDDALVSGLPATARVITAGAGFVSDGDKVSVVDPSRLSAER